MSLDQRLQRLWYGPAWRSAWLWPLEALFRAVVALRAAFYRLGLLRSTRVDVPVVVVGNLTVGGTGKTPVAAWLAQQLARRGRRVGIVLRGYGGGHRGPPRVVRGDDDPREVGDESLLHALAGAHVVVIGANRAAAAELARGQGAEVVICDDGLQHRALARDVDIAVIDGRRGLGNGHLLPAGPLREPASRLEDVHAVVVTRRDASSAIQLDLRRPLRVEARFAPGEAVNLRDGRRCALDAFGGRTQLHAVAGIGHPEAFFDSLRGRGLRFVEHRLPDHAALDGSALPFPAQATVLMTAKDAVKCRGFAGPDWWWVELEVALDRDDATRLLGLVLERTALTGAGVPLG